MPLLLRVAVAHGLRQLDLLHAAEQANPSDLAEVLAHGIIQRRTLGVEGPVELLGGDLLVLFVRRDPSVLRDCDLISDQAGNDLVDLVNVVSRDLEDFVRVMLGEPIFPCGFLPGSATRCEFAPSGGSRPIARDGFAPFGRLLRQDDPCRGQEP
jgi:hypothetical protein